MEKEPPSTNSNSTLHHSNDKTDPDALAIKSLDVGAMPGKKEETEKQGPLEPPSAPDSPQSDFSQSSSPTLPPTLPDNGSDNVPNNQNEPQTEKLKKSKIALIMSALCVSSAALPLI